MRYLAFGDADWNCDHKICHNGTFNANPLSAAAGVAMSSRWRAARPARARRCCATS